MNINVNDRVKVHNLYAADEELNGMTGQVIAINKSGSVIVQLDNGKRIWFLASDLRLVAKADASKDIPRKVSLADVLKHK